MSKNAKTLIRGARVVDPANQIDGTADILIDGGVIAAVGEKLDAPKKAKIVDADGLIAAPGLIDMHVHFREPGFEYKETIAGGCRAAAAGGVTSVATMPNTEPTTDDPAVVGYILDKAAEAGLANIFPIGSITKGLKGQEISEMGLMVKAGCVGFSDDGLPVMSSAVMRRALEYSRAFGTLVIQHAEDLTLVKRGCMNEGAMATRLGLPGIPNESEEILVDRDIRLARLTGGRYHVAHISTAGALASVAAAQKEGLPVSCEVTPHHFTLTDLAVDDYITDAKMAPPLRSRADRDALIEGLGRGVISVIATDHAPHDEDSKKVEFCCAANGVVGLETMLPLTLDLVREGVFCLSDGIAKMTINPARLMGIDRGTLTPGAPADVVLFDMNEIWTVDRKKLHGTSKNTCFHGREVKGRVKRTFLAGREVHTDGG